MTEIRNIAIIAHVDHGKTTLIDNLLKQSGIFRENQVVNDCVMDSNDLEKERGITILAKCTSFKYEDIKFNIIDTPGHADFGGEVERILSMVDGAVLLVDASEGPMPQTKFVLSKAISIGLKVIVVINKVDKQSSRVREVIDEVFDLFVNLDANEEQLDFPILYASGINGWASDKEGEKTEDLAPLFKVMSESIKAPKVDDSSSFSMLASLLMVDSYLGKLLIGKIYSGSVKAGDTVKGINLNGDTIESCKITKVLGFDGINKVPVESASAGDIIALAGLDKSTVSDTICDKSINTPIASTPIDPPTMSVTISVNDSPFAGKEGKKVTSRMILDRLEKEAESNVAITLEPSKVGDGFEIGGRGELQLAVLIETMRREGFELSVSRPKVLCKTDENGNKLEPIEEVVIDVDEEFAGGIIEKLQSMKGEMLSMDPSGVGRMKLVFLVPSRCLIGFQGDLRNSTKGTATLSRLFNSYQSYKGGFSTKRNGALISSAKGETTAYALNNLEARGKMIVGARVSVYEGMIVGENSKDNDLEVNPVKGKQLTNMRASGTDENIKLTPPMQMTLEEAISYIQDDELLEVTPLNIRFRKAILCPHERKKQKRSAQ